MLNFDFVRSIFLYGWIPEWPKGTDCKSAANCFGGSNPPPSIRWCGGIGRRKGLKIPRGQPRIGSSPITSSYVEKRSAKALRFFFVSRFLCFGSLFGRTLRVMSTYWAYRTLFLSSALTFPSFSLRFPYLLAFSGI